MSRGGTSVVRIEQWSVIRCGDIYSPPDNCAISLHGAVYGHPNFTDGEFINTSQVVGSTGRVVHCESRDYLLGQASPDFLAWLAETGKALDEVQPVKLG